MTSASRDHGLRLGRSIGAPSPGTTRIMDPNTSSDYRWLLLRAAVAVGRRRYLNLTTGVKPSHVVLAAVQSRHGLVETYNQEKRREQIKTFQNLIF